MKLCLSVIIPTLNEEKNLARTLAPLADKRRLEVIVVDGGSDDATVQIAASFGAVVILTEGLGRGGQLHRGVASSAGDLLLFLHGDTRLPDNFAEHIRSTLARKTCVAGAFSLGIDNPRKGLAFIACGANIRSRLLHLPYGDQGIFTSRNMYDRVGGFAPVPIMEDYIFIRKIRKYGEISILPEKVLTSARRWENMGAFRTTCINQLIVLGYHCGIPPSTLARWYQRLKGVQSATP